MCSLGFQVEGRLTIATAPLFIRKQTMKLTTQAESCRVTELLSTSEISLIFLISLQESLSREVLSHEAVM